jgi:ligand-binding SRPBCC domain-containing protein
LRDEVEYQAPLGMIGSSLGGWLIRRKLNRMFTYRHETTRRMIESGEPAGKIPAFEQRQTEGDK